MDLTSVKRVTFLPLTTPGASASTMNPLRALCGGVLGSSAVLASTKYQCATPPPVIHIFCPFNTYSSPLRTAFVRTPATSDPAPGSVTQYAWTHKPTQVNNKWMHCMAVKYGRWLHSNCVTWMLQGTTGLDKFLIAAGVQVLKLLQFYCNSWWNANREGMSNRECMG